MVYDNDIFLEIVYALDVFVGHVTLSVYSLESTSELFAFFDGLWCRFCPPGGLTAVPTAGPALLLPLSTRPAFPSFTTSFTACFAISRAGTLSVILAAAFPGAVATAFPGILATAY